MPLLCFMAAGATAQDTLRHDPTTLGLVGASLLPAGIVTGALYQNYITFWTNDESTAFHFSNDPPYALHNDKLGHAWFSTIASDVIRAGYEAAGVDRHTAAWLGFGIAAGGELIIEIGDGVRTGRPYYGFSPGDAAADLAGAALPLIRTYHPEWPVPDLKMSIWPSSAYESGAYNSIIDDNESQFFWLSFDLPDALPSWLNVAVGYGVENIPVVAHLPSRRDASPATLLFIAPDIDLRALPIEGDLWKFVTSILSHVRVPLPALQFTPRFKLWPWR